MIGPEERRAIREADVAREAAIAVDAFAPEGFLCDQSPGKPWPDAARVEER